MLAYNSSGRVTQVLDPSGVLYLLSYDSHGNLTSLEEYASSSSPSTWNYVYDTSQASPYGSDLVQVYDRLGRRVVASSSPGAAHSTYVAYNYSSYPGMATSIEDGTGATTTYSYSQPCATGLCLSGTGTQATTINYPAQPTCPSCSAQ